MDGSINENVVSEHFPLRRRKISKTSQQFFLFEKHLILNAYFSRPISLGLPPKSPDCLRLRQRQKRIPLLLRPWVPDLLPRDLYSYHALEHLLLLQILCSSFRAVTRPIFSKSGRQISQDGEYQ